MIFYIEIRYVADSPGIVLQDGHPREFHSCEEATQWGRKNIKGKLTAEWSVIDEENARKKYDFHTD